MHKKMIFFQKNLHMSKKSCTFAPEFKNNIINNKIYTTMSTKNYFETELNVHFTMSELSTIASALFTDWEIHKKNKRNTLAQINVELHDKLKKQMTFYNEIIK